MQEQKIESVRIREFCANLHKYTSAGTNPKRWLNLCWLFPLKMAQFLIALCKLHLQI
jgi:hypothetical protein